MKKIAMHATVMTCFLVAVAVVSSAQTVGLRVDIPFEFNVGEKVLPAGQYLILAPQGGTLKILGPNGAAAVALTNQVSGQRPDGPGMVDFNCYGQRCFLSQFWTVRTETGQEVIKSHLEKELASAKEQVAVIALRARLYQVR
jgi:hypothetical protein